MNRRKKEREDNFVQKWSRIREEYTKQERERAEKYIKSKEGRDLMDKNARKVCGTVFGFSQASLD